MDKSADFINTLCHSFSYLTVVSCVGSSPTRGTCETSQFLLAGVSGGLSLFRLSYLLAILIGTELGEKLKEKSVCLPYEATLLRLIIYKTVLTNSKEKCFPRINIIHDSGRDKINLVLQILL